MVNHFCCSIRYVSLSDNEKTGYKARELKSVHVDAIGLYLKLNIHKNHINKYNIYNQVRTYWLSNLSSYSIYCSGEITIICHQIWEIRSFIFYFKKKANGFLVFYLVQYSYWYSVLPVTFFSRRFICLYILLFVIRLVSLLSMW